MKKIFKILLKILLWGGGLLIMFSILLHAYVYFAGKDIPPPDDSDLAIDIPVVPDEENAFVYLIKASQAAVLPDCYSWGPPSPLPDNAADMLAQNQDAFSYIQIALDCSTFLPPRTFVWDERPSIRIISTLLSLDVHQAIADKDLDKAIQKISVRLELGRLEADNSLSIMQYLFAYLHLNYALADITIVAQQPDITAEQLLQLVGLLQSLPDPEHILRQTIKGEYQLTKTTMDEWSSLTGMPKEYQYIVRFGFLPNATLRDYARVMRNTLQSIPISYKDIPPRHEYTAPWYSWMVPNSKGQWLFNAFQDSVYGMLRFFVSFQTAQAAAETIVAFHRYKQQHHVLPDSLEALVPDFLPTVPIDPYDEQPLRYRPEQNIIYFVGTNLTDDGGQSKQSLPGRHNKREPDIVFAIEAPPPQ